MVCQNLRLTVLKDTHVIRCKLATAAKNEIVSLWKWSGHSLTGLTGSYALAIGKCFSLLVLPPTVSPHFLNVTGWTVWFTTCLSREAIKMLSKGILLSRQCLGTI